MKIETTPGKISDEIRILCGELAPESAPEYIKSIIVEGMKDNKCFEDVPEMIKLCGGQQAYGWAIWQWANMFIEAEPYTVWRNQNGELVDITPHGEGEIVRIVFVESDESHIMNEKSRFRQLTCSPLVKELLDIGEQMSFILGKYSDPIENELELKEAGERLKPLEYRKNEILKIMDRKVGRNDMCPCGSGLKYKRCCGRN